MIQRVYKYSCEILFMFLIEKKKRGKVKKIYYKYNDKTNS